MRTVRLVLALLALCLFARPALADDVGRAARGVVRVISSVQMANGESATSLGSGFAVAGDLIVTNYHVVAIHDRFSSIAAEALLAIVPSEGSRPFLARIVRTNPGKDLALLRMIDGRLPPLRIYGAQPDPGTVVTALGYPGAVDMATARSIRDYVTPSPVIRTGGEYSSNRRISGIDAYVHDAQIGHGNSGGPLVDRCGRVIGVNTFITSGEQGDATFAFAVSNRELIAFLGDIARPEGGPCVTTEERVQQRDAAIRAAADHARSDCENRNRDSQGRSEDARRAAEDQAKDDSDKRLFLSMAILLLGALVLGGAGLLYAQKQPRSAIGAAAVGALLFVVAIIAFVVRPPAGGAQSGMVPLLDCPAEAARAENATAANYADIVEDTDENAAGTNAM